MFLSLKTSVWTSALMRRASAAGAIATIVQKGDEDAGTALIKVRTLDGFAVLYRSMRNMEGARFWLAGKVLKEATIDIQIQERTDTDPDLWIIEIEDRDGRHFLTEEVEEADKKGRNS